MVQTYQSPVRVYKYPFELIMTAYERRFPTCKMIPVFLGSDIIYEHQDPDGASHIVERRCRLDVEVPYLLKKISGIEHAIFIQKNSLNRKNRKLVIEARNESFNTRVIIRETCTYTVHPENDNWTCFEQEASLDVKSFFGFEATVEKIAMKQYSANISKGKEIIEHFVKELAEQGITEVPPWKPGVVGTLYASDEERRIMGENAKAAPTCAGDAAAAFPSSSAGAAYQEEKKAPELHRRRSSTPKSGAAEAPEESDSDADDGFEDASSLGGNHDSPRSEDMRIPSSNKTPGPDGDGVDRMTPTRLTPKSASKLDSEYIERFLGQLSITQESNLVQLRNRLAETHKGKMPNDAHLLRFLRARDFNVEKARDMICHSIAWRKQHRVDNILNTYTPPEAMKFFPGGWHHHDKLGRPLYILRLGMMDVKGIMKSVGEEGLLRHIISIAEDGLRQCEQATYDSSSSCGPVSTFTCIFDLEGLSMRHLWRPGVKALLRIIEVMEANYPETLGRLIIVRAPRVFPVLWTLVHPFIDEKTREKFFVVSNSTPSSSSSSSASSSASSSGKESQEKGLKDIIDEAFIPEFLKDQTGGSSSSSSFSAVAVSASAASSSSSSSSLPCDIPSGGLVPKTFYLYHAHDFEGEPDKELPALFGEETIYKKANLVKGFAHEVLMQVAEKGSVLTWDFDVLKGEITFTVFRCKSDPSSPDNDDAEMPGGCVPMSATSGSLIDPSGVPSEGANQILPKEWIIGRDLTLVEKPVVFRDGDSIQGSHVTAEKGSYVLQWKWFEGTSKATSNLIDFPTFAHKSRIMYYTEQLKSEDFRGSLTSLQSLQCSNVSSAPSTSGVSVCASSGVSVSASTSTTSTTSCPSR